MQWKDDPHVFGLGGLAKAQTTAGPFYFLIAPVGPHKQPQYLLAMHYQGGTVLNTKTLPTMEEAKSAALPMALAQLDKWREEVEAAWTPNP